MNPKPQIKAGPVFFQIQMDSSGNPEIDRLRAVLAAFEGMIPAVKSITARNKRDGEELFIINQVLKNGSSLIRLMLANRGVFVLTALIQADEIIKTNRPAEPAADPDGSGPEQ